MGDRDTYRQSDLARQIADADAKARIGNAAIDLVERAMVPLRLATVGALPGIVVLSMGTDGARTRLLPDQARDLAEMLWRKADDAGDEP